jgi:hypothetical protein
MNAHAPLIAPTRAWHPEPLPPYIERTGDLELFEDNGRRAVVSFHRSLYDRLHWRVKAYGYRDGCVSEGDASRYPSPHAARDAARLFVSAYVGPDMAAFRAGRGAL